METNQDKRVCMRCERKTTQQWRRSQLSGDWLCNTCGMRERNNLIKKTLSKKNKPYDFTFDEMIASDESLDLIYEVFRRVVKNDLQ
jgi:late competence protein required for DNA uptake (superfamily II DNA/RNA helicase)